MVDEIPEVNLHSPSVYKDGSARANREAARKNPDTKEPPMPKIIKQGGWREGVITVEADARYQNGRRSESAPAKTH